MSSLYEFLHVIKQLLLVNDATLQLNKKYIDSIVYWHTSLGENTMFIKWSFSFKIFFLSQKNIKMWLVLFHQY